MEVKDINFKRFIADEGMALKWKVKSWDYRENEATEGYMYSPYEALIDINSVIGNVEEITKEQYEEETKTFGLCGSIFN